MKQFRINLWKDGQGIALNNGREGVEVIADVRNKNRCENERTFILLCSDCHGNDFDAVIDQPWKAANSCIKLMGLGVCTALRDLLERAFMQLKISCAYDWQKVRDDLRHLGFDVANVY